MKSFSEYTRIESESSVEEMFGIPNRVAGMHMLGILLTSGVLKLYFAKDYKGLVAPEHHAYVEGNIKGRTMRQLSKDATPEGVIRDLRRAWKPSKIEIEVV